MKSVFAPGTVDADLAPAPIFPAWIVDGNPVARNNVLARCPLFTMSIWDCTAGAFFWYYGTEETVYILQGEVVITDVMGRSRTLVPGDAALFAAGDWLHWHVPQYVRKFAVWGESTSTIARYVAGRLGAKAGRAVRRQRTSSIVRRPPAIAAMTA